MVNDKQNELFLKNVRSNFTDEIVCSLDKNEWIENIIDERLYYKLKILSREEIEILTLHIIYGYNQREVAQKIDYPIKKICRKLTKIKKFLK